MVLVFFYLTYSLSIVLSDLSPLGCHWAPEVYQGVGSASRSTEEVANHVSEVVPEVAADSQEPCCPESRAWILSLQEKGLHPGR